MMLVEDGSHAGAVAAAVEDERFILRHRLEWEIIFVFR
jgi:hypothetical protein